MSDTPFISEKELAARWKCTARTLRNYRTDGDGPQFVRIGPKSVAYRLDDVLAYEDQRTAGGMIPARAQRLLTRSADAFEAMLKWPMKDDARALLTSLLTDIRQQIRKEK